MVEVLGMEGQRFHWPDECSLSNFESLQADRSGAEWALHQQW